MSGLKIVTQGEKNFVFLWEDFCKRNKTSIFFEHIWLDFCGKIARDNFLKNLSFAVVKDDLAVAIAPLIMEKGIYGKQFSVRNKYLLRAPVPSITVSDELRQEIEKVNFSYIEGLAHSENVCFYMASVDSMSLIDQKYPHNFLLKQNFTDCSLLTNMIDLDTPAEVLFSRLRKSFKSLIKRENKQCQIIIVDYKNVSKELFDNFPRLYFQASGKNVYTDSEWDALHRMIVQDLGMVIFVQFNKEIIGGSYFSHSNSKVYYSFSANDPDYETSNYIGHILIWRAIEYYSQRGFKWLELGWQFFGPQLLENPSEKEVNISFFKRGFGGFHFPAYRGIKFFDTKTKKEYLERNLSV